MAAHLAAEGIRGVVPPVSARSGELWSVHDGVQLAVHPWVAGRRGMDVGLDPVQWRDFGALLARVHGARVPDSVPREDFTAVMVATARTLDERMRGLAGELPDLWRAESARIAALVRHAEELSHGLRNASAPLVLCHADAHLGNVLAGPDGELWLIDWDGALPAPPERDLMFVLGGVLADRPVTEEQQAWFLDGYGPVQVDRDRLSYYLCSRALDDVTDFAVQILDGPVGARAGRLDILRGLFSAVGLVPIALASRA